MPALPVPGPVLRVEFETNDLASIAAGSRFYVGYSGGPPDAADLDTLAGAVASAWTTHMAPMVNSNEHLVGVTITDLSSSTGAIGAYTGNVAGSRSGPTLPASACAVVNHRIARRYRGGRPRTYVRAGVQSDLEGTNTWTSGFLTDMLAAWEAWIAAILGTTGIGITSLQIQNIGYYEGNLVFTGPTGRARNIPQLRKVGGVPTPYVDNITSSSVALKVGSQKRRLDI
jgi:hypothetical protein